MPKNRVCANDTVLPALTRRAALAAPLGLLPSNISARNKNKSEILWLFDRHEQLRQQLNAENEDAAEDRIFKEMQAVECRLMAQPSITAADFAAKAIVESAHGILFPDWESGQLWIEARKLVG
ncbi:hypothetical protein [Profundibacter sp.]